MREDGYYWVLIGADAQSEWKVAEWRDDYWWTCGSEMRWTLDDTENYFRQIGERITRDGK